MKLFKKKWKIRTVLVVVCILIVLLGIDLYRSKECLTVSSYTVSAEQIAEEIQMVVLADLHNHEFGKENQKLLEEVKKQNPDVIFCVGDLLNGDERDPHVVEKLLEGLCQIAPVYVSYGNHEVQYEEKFGVELRPIFEACGATVLEYDFEEVEIRGQKLCIGGLYGYCVPEKYLASKEANLQECRFLDQFMDTDAYTIFLCHMPCMWTVGEALTEWEIDLVLSGHSHGGQIRIPFLGGLYAPDEGWFSGKTEGMYVSEGGERQMILSRGLGSSERVPRINNVPEIVTICLK